MVKFADSWTLLSSLATSMVRGNCALPCKAISALKDAINVINNRFDFDISYYYFWTPKQIVLADTFRFEGRIYAEKKNYDQNKMESLYTSLPNLLNHGICQFLPNILSSNHR
jgi:hypothetical protein